MEWLPWVLVFGLSVVCTVLVLRNRSRSASSQRAASPSGSDVVIDGPTSALPSLVERRAQRVGRQGGAFCLLAIGVDNFGMLIGAFGRMAGERLMAQAAEQVAALAGAQHDLVRDGDGRLALLVSGGQAIGAPLAKRLQAAMTQLRAAGVMESALTVSIGVAVYPDHGAHETLHDHALLAMRNIRNAGGAAIACTNPR